MSNDDFSTGLESKFDFLFLHITLRDFDVSFQLSSPSPKPPRPYPNQVPISSKTQLVLKTVGDINFKFHLSLITEFRNILDTEVIERLTMWVRRALEAGNIHLVKCGASLVSHGLLGSLNMLRLYNDLSQVPAQHLASLAACVTEWLHIKNISGCDLVSALTSLRCHKVYIRSQSLDREETWALVQAMESGVERVLWGGVTLDIQAFIEYSGQGVCRNVELQDDTMDRCKDELVTWAGSRKWRIHVDEDYLRNWSIIRKLSSTKMVITPV